MNAPTPAIALDRVEKFVRVGFLGRRKRLLHGLSFEVPRGVIFGFVGHNGAGKSTTIKHLFGALRPSAGTVRVLGSDPLKIAGRRRVGYLPELPRLAPTLTPMEFLRLHSALMGLDGWRDDAETLLARVGLSEHRDQRVGGFSKGMQQRLGLALALLGDPELLILDEPMSGLDPVGRALVRDLIREEHQRGATVFFSSHILSDVEALCQQIAVIHRGEIVAHGAIDELLGAPVGFALEVRMEGELPDEVRALGEWRTRGDGRELRVPSAPMDAADRVRAAGGEVTAVEPVRVNLEDQLLKWFEVDP